jgi:hypothetical protein
VDLVLRCTERAVPRTLSARRRLWLVTSDFGRLKSAYGVPISGTRNNRVGPEKGKPPATAGRKAPGLLEVGREVAELPKDPSPLGSVPLRDP